MIDRAAAADELRTIAAALQDDADQLSAAAASIAPHDAALAVNMHRLAHDRRRQAGVLRDVVELVA